MDSNANKIHHHWQHHPWPASSTVTTTTREHDLTVPTETGRVPLARLDYVATFYIAFYIFLDPLLHPQTILLNLLEVCFLWVLLQGWKVRSSYSSPYVQQTSTSRHPSRYSNSFFVFPQLRLPGGKPASAKAGPKFGTFERANLCFQSAGCTGAASSPTKAKPESRHTNSWDTGFRWDPQSDSAIPRQKSIHLQLAGPVLCTLCSITWRMTWELHRRWLPGRRNHMHEWGSTCRR